MSATSVTALSVQLNRYAPIPLLVLGTIGNILNILIFTRPRLIKNPCSTYFFCSSIAGVNVLVLGVLSRFLSDGFGIDPVSYHLEYCRFRYFILHCSMVLSSWFTILASIDRYCISSRNVHRRQLSNLKHSRYLAVLTACVCMVLYSHIFGLFDMEQLKSGPYRYAQAGTYRVFYDFLFFATFSFTPPIVMIIFGLATLHNVHRIGSQIVPTATNNGNVGQLKKRDRQLIRMLLVQVVFTACLTSPLAIQKLYATITQYVPKGAYQVAVENLIAQAARILAFANSCISFYVFVFSGSGFRYEFGQLMLKLVGYLFGKNSRLYGRAQICMEDAPTVQAGTLNRTVTLLHQH